MQGVGRPLQQAGDALEPSFRSQPGVRYCASMASASRNWWPRRLALAFAAWTAVGAFLVAQRYLFDVSLGARFDLFASLVQNLPSVWLWALITPLIMNLSRLFPLQSGKWHKNLVFHFLFGLAFLCGDVLLDMLVAQWLPAARQLSLPARLSSKSFINLFSYAAVVALAHALQYSRQLSERKARTAELEKEVLAAQLTALQMQLRPHFLFNALNSVASLIRSRQGPKAIRAVTGLADLLRLVLKRDGAQLVPLRQEMELVDRYLRIEQIRFEHRLDAKVHVEPQVLDALVPCLVLQPLVENAVHHGIDSTEGVGRVYVEARRDVDMIRIWVRNSGPLLDLSAAEREANGVGLRNTRARLNHLYGPRHRLELRPDTGGGALAELVIPFDTGAGPEAVP